MRDTHYAWQDQRSNQFIADLIALCRKYNMVAVPTSQGEVSLHDKMIIIPFDKDAQKFLIRTAIEATET